MLPRDRRQFHCLVLHDNYHVFPEESASWRKNLTASVFGVAERTLRGPHRPYARSLSLMATTGSRSAPLKQRIFCWPLDTGCLLLVWAIVLLVASPATALSGDAMQPRNAIAIGNNNNNNTGICKSVDIRNTLDQFETLQDCTVVEGFVQILLFDNVNESLFMNISFPQLTEITDYLLLYRVNGLRSIGQLFPNLAVIRGQKLFFGYAFVVFEMSSLQEIGLFSLTDITRGQIRIDKNPSLCFVNTIDWDLISHEKGEHFIRSIKPENECPICPSGDTIQEETGLRVTCPQALHHPGIDSIPEGRYLCWNRQHCQKVCSPNCKTCNGRGECCDHKCLGGCDLEKIEVCKVCRNFSMGTIENRQCMSHCPIGYYEYLERRCIRHEDCINLKRPLDLHVRVLNDKPYKIYNGSCILQCPPNYMDDFENHTCKPCLGRCKKECPGTNIDSLASAQLLRGCTHINGSLEIQIRGGRNIVNELEENLNMIEEIDGYIKIVRSFPLVSLNFFKNLRVIHGNILESQKYVFVVLDNQNLQELLDFDNRTIRIDNGRLFFHFNPKLCMKKIELLREKTNLGAFTDLEVARNSNGDKIACEIQNMTVVVRLTGSRAVILQWDAFKMGDHRRLLGYVVYSIEAPYTNVTLYDGRDACGGDGWRVDDVGIPEDNATSLTHILTQLKPYTQYAYYVKTYTVATENSGAQSQILYFRTLPDVPTKPVNVQVVSNSSNALYISWQPPLQRNGNVTHYIVSGQRHRDMNNDDLLNNRNYCEHPSLIQNEVLPVPITITTPKTKTNDTCACDDNPKQSGVKIKEEKEILSQISFEDALHNQVYIKKDRSEMRKKRDTRDIEDSISFPMDIDSRLPNSINNSIRNITENGTALWESFNFPVYGKTDLYINNLRHFTVYNIHVQACREVEGSDDKAPTCSDISIKTARTAKKDGADNITQLHITNQSLGIVTIAWDEPVKPNGLILTYEIEYKRMDVENSQSSSRCITRKAFFNQSMTYTLKQLNSGNYSLRVLAISQAGRGDFSPYVYFFIKDAGTNATVQIVSSLVAIVVICSIFVGLFYLRRRYAPPLASLKLIASINPEYISSVYVPDEWEVARKKIELIRELGQGSFGMVYEGIVRDVRGKPELRCAIKTVNEHATNRERIEFLNEASVMKAFDTAHVVRLLGVVSQGQPTLVIMELMVNGDLKSYLRSHRPDAETYRRRHPPTLRRILQMAMEIADGMAYLAAKKFVHRDLAARNCMVAEELTVKIGDFGMTRDIYETDYYRKGTRGLLPVRWMAPESLKDGVFTSSSDVWSYGIVLWEMATLASQPYQGLSNDQVLRYVIDGGVMERPDNCPDKLYTLMRLCWQHKQASRPTFMELASQLVDDAGLNFTRVSFYHSAAGVEARNAHLAHSPSQDDPSTPLRTVHEVDEDFSLGSSESEPEIEVDQETRIEFPTFQPPTKDCSIAANGYVSGRPTNGTATTQC